MEPVCKMLDRSKDHPDAEQLHQHTRKIDPAIAVARVYRMFRIPEDGNLIIRHDFGKGRIRFEVRCSGHHDCLIDLETGNIAGFHNYKLEALATSIA